MLQKLVPLLILLICRTSVCTEEAEPKEELVESESKDGKLEIIKRIKKVNEDGSYTIGYEADDGSFKIESRDVLGNIKGTYGFLDDEGQIKRVSYSTSNSTDLLGKTEAPSVVQRIPKLNRTTSSTKRPSPSTTPSTTTTNLASRRRATTTTTTSKPNYSDVINISSGTTTRPLIYTSPPRVLLQGRSNLGSTVATHIHNPKSEGQLDRPEVIIKPTEIPLFRRLALKHELLEDAKPVIEVPEVRSNILRRQLAHEKTTEFNAREHISNLQQSDGDDIPDVYSGSITTTAPRHIFSTTLRPRIISTTAPPVTLRPIRYTPNYQSNILQNIDPTTPEYAQESSTTESTIDEATPTPVPIVQIPPNRQSGPEPLVAIRHPFQRGTILVPLSQLQQRIVPLENARDESMENQYVIQNIRPNDQYIKETTPKPLMEQQPRPIVLRRVPPPLRPIPVQVDENGYIREVPQPVPTPFPLPIPITPVPKYSQNDIQNEVDHIEPPVSTREFQQLLHQLILRQSRLERINDMMNPRRAYTYVQQPQYRPVYQPTPAPYFIPRNPNGHGHNQQSGPVQFIPDQDPRRQYQTQQPQPLTLRQQNQDGIYNDQFAQSFVPTRRVARLLQRPNEEQEQYLPPDVREMLLLRMLQLALNPSLPIEEEEEAAEPTTQVPQYKKAVRNVEILGEENEEMKTPTRIKRYKESEYYY